MTRKLLSMTAHFPTTRHYSDVTTNATSLNTTMMTSHRQKTSASPVLWIPYVFIGVSCVAFLAVHFWCYHKRNRQRYLRKREEKRVKCGLMERRRITTLMVSRYQSDIDAEGLMEAQTPGSMNGDLHRPNDELMDGDHDLRDPNDPRVNGRILNGHMTLEFDSDGKSPSDPFYASQPTKRQALRKSGHNTDEDDDARPEGGSKSLRLVHPVLFPCHLEGVDSEVPPQYSQLRNHNNRQLPRLNATGFPDSADFSFDSSSPNHYHGAGFNDNNEDGEEDAASVPVTPSSPKPNRSRSFTRLKTGTFPNVIYSTISQSLSPDEPSSSNVKTISKKRPPDTLGDLYEDDMNGTLSGDSNSESKPRNGNRVPTDLDPKTLQFLDCNKRKELLWACTPPRASPERDLDCVIEWPNLVNERRSEVEIKTDTNKTGGSPSSHATHQTSRDNCPTISTEQLKSPLINNPNVSMILVSDDMTDNSKNDDITTATIEHNNSTNSASHQPIRSSRLSKKESDSQSSPIPSSPVFTEVSTPSIIATVSTDNDSSNLETPFIEKANKIELPNDTTGTPTETDKGGNSNRP